MTSKSRRAGAFTVFGCAILLIASGCKDTEARTRLDHLETWADGMTMRADQNIQWAYDQLDYIHNWICSEHPDPAKCPLPGNDSDPTQPPDSIPTLLR